jgi:hypothetical protein
MSSKKDRSEVKRQQRRQTDVMERDDDDDDDSSRSDSSAPMTDPFVRALDAYDSWKQNLPLLYDCFIHSNLEWPSYACAWGPVIPEKDGVIAPVSSGVSGGSVSATPTPTQQLPPSAPPTPTTPALNVASVPQLTGAALIPRSYSSSYATQHLFLSRSTDSKLERDKWIGSPNMLLKAEIYYPNQYRAQDISKMQNFDEDQRNPCLIVRKKIVHPGEINRIKGQCITETCIASGGSLSHLDTHACNCVILLLLQSSCSSVP